MTVHKFIHVINVVLCISQILIIVSLQDILEEMNPLVIICNSSNTIHITTLSSAIPLKVSTGILKGSNYLALEV